jgi:hypothetical protein
MRKYAFLSIVLLIPFLANAGHILIWNYDPFDRYFDAEYGDSVDCAYWLEQAVAANGHTYQTRTTLPGNLDSYDAVLVTLGWYRC